MLLYINHIIVGIILAHAFGRIGCFLRVLPRRRNQCLVRHSLPERIDPIGPLKRAGKSCANATIESFFARFVFVLHFKKNQDLPMSYGLFRF